MSWTLLCALGLAGGLSVGLGLARPIQAVVGMMLVTPIALALSGSLLGVSQSLLLWRRDPAGLGVFFVVAGLIVGLVTARPALRLGVTRPV